MGHDTQEIRNNGELSIALLKQDMEYVKKGIQEIKEQLDNQKEEYVSKVEFILTNREQGSRIDRIEKLVYSAVALGLVTLGKAVLELVVTTNAAP